MGRVIGGGIGRKGTGQLQAQKSPLGFGFALGANLMTAQAGTVRYRDEGPLVTGLAILFQKVMARRQRAPGPLPVRGGSDCPVLVTADQEEAGRQDQAQQKDGKNKRPGQPPLVDQG